MTLELYYLLAGIAVGALAVWLVLHRKIRRLTKHAYFDPLTELPNYLLCLFRLHRLIARTRKANRRASKDRREKGLVAVIFLDLNGFKPINDTYNHDIGDTLLRMVAARLHSFFKRTSDVVARRSGDEFIIIAQMSDRGICRAMVRGVYDLVAQPYKMGGGLVIDSISASFGIALYPFDGKKPAELLKLADRAMYHAKHTPDLEPRIHFVDPEMRHERHLQLVKKIA